MPENAEMKAERLYRTSLLTLIFAIALVATMIFLLATGYLMWHPMPEHRMIF